eukprot:CAMPEP_0201526462 /NCGR_PEP_ID=MMETSP0161_2-20130828/31935_1 /ASSEMBLY_ACC=CAM_ASM_000251 /TAXON_ID=180227 /ORGANISM="Neoparamoeba aestuarina, Strain SoJaBio B1-5/56/2" /LENGTH=220 /DNA_ID=CAMNT_0047926863 /DNA_START=69 /DNA_END=728 /DNA_ORIENTATION=-
MANTGEVKLGKGGLEYVTITHKCGAEADIYLHGAHVTRFLDQKEGDDFLFLSEKAKFVEGGAIRGGIPVIFPQFSDMGPLPKHGFVRNNKWELKKLEQSTAHFIFCSSETTKKAWGNVDFELSYVVTLFEKEEGRGGMRVELKFENKGKEKVEFCVALHTYFAVESVEEVSVEGLKRGGEGGGKLEYIDNTDGRKVKTDENEKIFISGEIDRVYLSTGPQ